MQTNISKKLKRILSINYLMDTILEQSDIQVPIYLRKVIVNTTVVSHRKHKEKAIKILINNLDTILKEAKAEGKHVEDKAALYILACSLGSDTIRNIYGLSEEAFIKPLEASFTLQDVEYMFYLFNALEAKYGTYRMVSNSRIREELFKPKKEKKPRDKSKKPIKQSKKKSRKAIKAKEKKERALAKLRGIIKELKEKHNKN